MPDVTITIGGREFMVACQEGEEHFLQTAAGMLDTEASTLIGQIGQINESRMLLMAGLMLADKTAGMEDKLRIAEGQMEGLQAELETLRAQSAEVPEGVTDTLAEIAARAEAMASRVEDMAG